VGATEDPYKTINAAIRAKDASQFTKGFNGHARSAINSEIDTPTTNGTAAKKKPRARESHG
jgi:hypothetical protein